MLCVLVCVRGTASKCVCVCVCLFHMFLVKPVSFCGQICLFVCVCVFVSYIRVCVICFPRQPKMHILSSPLKHFHFPRNRSHRDVDFIFGLAELVVVVIIHF